MRTAPLLALALLVPTGLLLAASGPAAAQTGEPAWWDEDWPFRLVVEAQQTAEVPRVGQASTDLVGYEISFERALERAGWPSSLVSASDPGSLVVVPYSVLRDGAQPGEPIPRRVTDPVSSTGSCEPTVTGRCLVAWEPVEGAQGYGIYWGPASRELEAPDAGSPPTLVGTTMGQEHWALLGGFDQPQVHVHPVPGDARVTAFTPTGTQTVLGSNLANSPCSADRDVLTCPVPSERVSVFTSRPTVVTVSEAGRTMPPHVVPLVGSGGQVGSDLRSVIPSGPWTSTPELVLWSHEGTCEGGCSAQVEPLPDSENPVEVSPSAPQTVELPQQGTALPVTVSTDEPVHAALRGTGFAPFEARDADRRNVWLPTDGFVGIQTPETTVVDLIDRSRSEILREDRTVEPPLAALSLPKDTETLEIASDSPIHAYAGRLNELSSAVHTPIPIRDRLPIPGEARLVAVSPRLGGATQTAEVASLEGREPSSNLLRLSAGASRQVVAAGPEMSIVDLDTDAPMGFLVTGEGQSDSPLFGAALGARHPAEATVDSANYLADAIDVSVTPESTFAGSGAVVTFNITVRNLARASGDTTPSLTADLQLDPLGAAEGNVSTTLEQSTVTLPGERGAQRQVSFSVRVAEGLSDVVLPIRVNATVEGPDGLTASAKSRVSVVTIRDFQLTFGDGSREQTQTAKPGGTNTFRLQVRNTGTVPTSVTLDRETFGGEGFEACLASAGGACESSITLEDIEPGSTRTARLRVESPDKESEDRLEISVRGELAERSGPVRTVSGTVFLNVPVVASIDTAPSRLQLAPGESETVDVTVTNLGVQSDATLSVPAPSSSINATLLDPRTGEPNRTLSKLLGPRNTKAATWESELRIEVAEDAPPGLSTEALLDLRLQPGGGLPSKTVTSKVGVEVIRVLTAEPLSAPTIPPGTTTTIEVPLQLDAFRDTSVDVRLIDAPPLWNVTPPENLTFDSRGQTVLRFDAAPPPGAPAGNATLRFGVLDPLGPGGALPVELGVARGGQAQLTTRERAAVALGGSAVLPLDVRNVGNAPLSGEVTLDGAPANLTLTAPPVPSLAPENGTATLPATLRATEPFEGRVSIGVLDGNRPAGNTSLEVHAARAEISLASERIVPRGDPKAGESYPVTVTVNNQGPVPVRNLTVALNQGDARVADRVIERLPARGNATVTIEWLPQRDGDRSQLSVEADPDGVLIQDRSDDALSLDEARDTPGPALLLTLVSLAVPSGLRGVWRLMSRRERWLAVGGLLLLVVLIPALFLPAIAIDPAPASPGTPEEVIDTDDDGLSDTAEITRYGTAIDDGDTDEDGMPDGWEAQHARFNGTFRDFRPDPGRADAREDPDADGLSNLGEFRNDTDPHEPDTDDDGFPDGWEVRSGLDPTSSDDPEADCDRDGLANRRELDLDTLACREDSDRDGVPDPAELDGEWTFEGETFTFEPTDPARASTGGSGSPDGWLLVHDRDPHAAAHDTDDPDGDELSTTREWTHTAAQALRDPTDWSEGLDPTVPDTDGDGLPDGWEVRNGLDPLDPEDGGRDPDGDGLANGQEFQAGSDPDVADTDGEGLSDGEEVDGYDITVKGETVHVRSNPLITDTDGDGLSDLREREGQAGDRTFPPTNPLSGDTDGDGLSDSREVLSLEAPKTLDPTVADTDNDGLLDGEEWDRWKAKAEKARNQPSFATRVQNQARRSVENVSAVLEPTGDLDADGEPNVLDPNADAPPDLSSLPKAQRDSDKDGEEVFPAARAGRTLPSSDPALRDTDGDGLPDSWEREHTRFDSDLGGWLLDPGRADSDGDGVPDAEEDLETACYDGDATGDGVPWFDAPFPNEDELERDTDPLDCDTDGDGLPDGWEVAGARQAQSAGVQIRLNPGNPDSDNDGTPDGDEVSPVPVPSGEALLWIDHPACTASGPRTGEGVCLYRWGEGVPDRTIDTQRTNATFATTPANCNRGPPSKCRVVRAVLTLGHEVAARTDPGLADTDGDGYADAWELLHGLDPTDAVSPREDSLDVDPGPTEGDGLTVLDEYQAGTDPFNRDTDKNGRGLADGVDPNPLDPTDDTGDCDWDGLEDPEEAQQGASTQPGAPDTDGDGLLDRSYNPDGCTVDGEVLRRPTPGEDLIAVPNPNADPDDTEDDFLGEATFGTKPNAWATSNDDLPDGWKALYDLDPATSHTTTDTDGDGATDTEEYELGRPPWWDEFEHGAWWFGSNPRSPSTRDLDGDGLDDGLFDPQPLSPDNDCQLPEAWSLPPAWEKPRCLEDEPAEGETDEVVAGLRQLAFDHVVTAENPEANRSDGGASDSVEVHTEGLEVSPDVLATHEPIDVRVPLCAETGDGCTRPDTSPPLVGLYAVTQRGADPNPKENPLLCVVDPAQAGDAWVADTTDDGVAQVGADACPLGPGRRTLANDTDALVLAPHAHGTVRPGGSWTVEPDDIEPGNPLRLAAWPLPTEADGTPLVADQTEEPATPATVQETPTAEAAVSLQGDPILRAGEEKDVRVQLADAAGYVLPDRTVEASWAGDEPETQLVDSAGVLNLTLDAIDTDQPLRVPLNVTFGGSSLIDGTEAAFELPVRIGSRLTLNVSQGAAPGTLPATVALADDQGNPLPGRTVTASARLPGEDVTVSANATTGEGGGATIPVPLPAGTNPGQAKVDASFGGDETAAPSTAQGLADVTVQPRLAVDAPDRARLTDGVPVTANLTLPNGDPLTPAPGEALEVVFRLGDLQSVREVVSAPEDGTLDHLFSSSPDLPLGESDLVVELRQGRFNPAASASQTVQVRSGVEASLSPTVVGIGVPNNLTVTVRDALGRSVEDATVEVGVRNVTGTGTTDPQGEAPVKLRLPLSADRGAATASLDVEPTNRTLPLSTDVDARVRLGTRFDTSGNLSGSLEGFSLRGRLVTATGEGVEDALVHLRGLGSLDLVTAPDGAFTAQIDPPPDTEPGNHTLRLSYDGEETLAPAQARVQARLFRPVNVTVDDPPLVPLGGQARVTGELRSNGEPVPGARVQLAIGNRTAEATSGPDGGFEVSGPLPDTSAGTVDAAVRVPRQEGLAAASRAVELRVVEPVELTATKTTGDDGVTVTVQAATRGGEPVADAPIVAVLPGGQVQLTTDDTGVARYRLASDTVQPGTEVEFLYQGSQTRAPASTTVTVQSTGTAISGTPVGIGVVLAVIAIEAVILWRVYRRRKVVQTVAEAVRDLEHRLRAGDELRAAVVHTFRRIQSGLEALGQEEAEWETHREFLDRSFEAIAADVPELDPFMDLLDRAQYGAEPMQPQDRVRALELSQGILEGLVEAPARGGGSA